MTNEQIIEAAIIVGTIEVARAKKDLAEVARLLEEQWAALGRKTGGASPGEKDLIMVATTLLTGMGYTVTTNDAEYLRRLRSLAADLAATVEIMPDGAMSLRGVDGFALHSDGTIEASSDVAEVLVRKALGRLS